VESRLACSASPERARSLLTVRAAISLAVFSERPRCSKPSLTCSYCRSRGGGSVAVGDPPILAVAVETDGAAAATTVRVCGLP
jgi:hypothetical protein